MNSCTLLDDFRFASQSLDRAQSEYNIDPCPSSWEMVELWRDIVADLTAELEFQ